LAAQVNLRHSIQNPAEDCRTNVLGTVRLLEECKKANVRKFIYFSTGGAIYDENAKRPWTELSLINPLTKLDPKSPYGVSKMCAEEYVKRLSKRYAILRPSNVYGPRQDPKGEAGVISIFRDCILKDKPCRIFGNGEQTRDYVYVDDVVSAAEMCMTRISGTFNVSTGIETSLNHLVDMMYRVSRKKKNVVNEPAIPGEMIHCCLSNEWLRQTGWQPRWSLKDGLKNTMRD
jgi:UDP-glucose 4-epimerase